MIKKNEWFLLIFNLLYIIPFTIYYISIRNFEFLWYIAILVFFFGLIVGLQRKIQFSNVVLILLSIWGLLHMAGGGVRVNGQALYALQLIPIWVTDNFYILKYDQVVHAFIYFVMVFVLYHLVKNRFDKKTKKGLIYLFVGLASIGVGALNEVAEFMAVLFFEQTGVGGYYNTAWDIVFNTFGALIGLVVLHFKLRRK